MHFSRYTRKNLVNQIRTNMLSENEILRFLANIIMIIFDINSRNIYHRDLKPENFLIKRDKNGNIYLHLIDFEIAKSSINDEDRLNTTTGRNLGTLAYMAPEIVSAITEKPDITK